MINSGKKWVIIFIITFSGVLFCAGAVTVVIDPYFHYHKPISVLQYPLDLYKARYLNDGIMKHFDYDAIIVLKHLNLTGFLE